MDEDGASKFVSSLVKSIQSLCNGYIDFASSIEVIGHIHLNIDRNLKFNYVLSEEVIKSQNEDATVFSSHSYHSHPPSSVASVGPTHAQTVTAEHSKRKSHQSEHSDLSVPSVQPVFSTASGNEDSSRPSLASLTHRLLDRRRKMQDESSFRPSQPKHSHINRPDAVTLPKTEFELEVIDVKDEPDDGDSAVSFCGQNNSRLSATRDISQSDFSNLVSDTLDRVVQLEGTPLLTGTDGKQNLWQHQQQQPVFPPRFHSSQAARAGQASISAASDGLNAQGSQASTGAASSTSPSDSSFLEAAFLFTSSLTDQDPLTYDPQSTLVTPPAYPTRADGIHKCVKLIEGRGLQRVCVWCSRFQPKVFGKRKSRTVFGCSICNVTLHPHCFAAHHGSGVLSCIPPRQRRKTKQEPQQAEVKDETP